MLLSALQNGVRPREPRVTVLVPCRLNHAGRWNDACIHNVSSRGLLVASSAAPPTGAYVDIRRGTLVMIGRVAWTKGRYFGVRTQDRISADLLVKEPRGRQGPRHDAEERRPTTRLQHEGTIARRLERSRAFASAFQFGLVLVAGGGAAVFVAMEMYAALARPMGALKAALGG